MFPWQWSVEELLDGMLDWIATQVIDVLDALWGLLADTFLIVPQVSALPQVQTLSARSLAVVNAGFVVVIMICGIVVMTRETVQTRYGIGELAPRLVLGFIAANFAGPISSAAITITNALRVALTGDGITTEGSLGHIRSTVAAAIDDPAAGLLVLIIVVIVAVLVAMLWVGWIIRLGVLVILVGIAPVALACHATPWTEPTAKLWWRTLLAALGTVILQALMLHAAFAVFLDPQANLPLLGIPVADEQAVLVNLMIVTVLLWTTVKIPGLMRRYVTHGQSNNVVAAVMRIAMVQQLGRVFTGRALAAGGRVASRSTPPGPRGARTGTAPGPGPGPVRTGGPRPGQPPRFSHASARHRPIPRPAAATITPVFSARGTAATPAPAPGASHTPAFSHLPGPQPPAAVPSATALPAFSHRPTAQPVRTPPPSTPGARFSHPPTPASPPPPTTRVPGTPAFSHPRPQVRRGTPPPGNDPTQRQR